MGSGCCKEKNTLCWECDKACGKCSWSQNFTPVLGWEATPTKVYQTKGVYQDSFLIHKCPEFKKTENNFRCEIRALDLAALLNLKKFLFYQLEDGQILNLCKLKNLNIYISYTKQGKRKFYMIERRSLRLPPLELMQLFFGKQRGYTGF